MNTFEHPFGFTRVVTALCLIDGLHDRIPFEILLLE